MAMEYHYDATDGELIRFDRRRDINEGYNWKLNKWENCPEAYDASVGTYDGFLHKITEQEADEIIRKHSKMLLCDII